MKWQSDCDWCGRLMDFEHLRAIAGWSWLRVERRVNAACLSVVLYLEGSPRAELRELNRITRGLEV
jgi:hypothetical protein